ncbi:MAG: tetratricopeptide repeat protein [Proteobacteria bacterium]|nr:tetratricopeptide repeat protein [Pseudomonadota bacterium]MBU1595728.1 tetratricopeptide repeat protein [Pseudomonadota bacterium]
MKISAWQTILFIILIVGATWLVFPGPRTLISIYIQDNKGALAQSMLDKLLARNPDDPDLNMDAAELAQYNGEVDKALGYLAKVLQLRPGRPELLLRMAEWREWSGQPMEAAASLEAALMAMSPAEERRPESLADRRGVLLRLLDIYLYQGDAEGSFQSAQRLIPLDKVVLAKEIAARKSLQQVSAVLEGLSATLGKGGGDAVSRALLVDAYILRRGYLDDIGDGKGGPEAEKIFVADALEQLVRGGLVAEATRLARMLDQQDKSVNSRLAVAVALGGYGADKDAAQLMADLVKERPNDAALMGGLAEMAMNADQPQEAVKHLQRLAQLSPADSGVQRHLGEALLAASRPSEAYDVLVPLPVETVGDANLLLDAAAGVKSAQAVERAAQAVQALAQSEPLVGVKLADAWLDAKRPREAWELLRKYAAESGGDPVLIRKAVEAASQTNSPGTLREVLALIERPDFADTALLLEVATMLADSGELRGAAKVYERYLARNPGDRKTALRLAEVHSWRGAPDLSFAVLDRLLKASPGDKALLKLAGTYAEEAGKDADAYRIYGEMFRQNPKDKTARENFLRLAEWTGKTAERAKLLAEDSDREPRNAQKSRQAAEAYLAANESKRALPYLQRALALKNDDIGLRRLLADTLGGLGLVDRQAETLEPLAALGVLTEDEAVLVAQRHLDRKQAQKAYLVLKRFEDMTPIPWDAGALLVQAYTQLNRQEPTQQLMRRLKHDYESDPERLAAIGDMAVLHKRLDFAMEAYAAALKVDPSNRAALKGTAQIYAWNNDAQRAIKGFENYRVRHPSDIEARYQLGELYYTTDRPEDAFGEYKKTLSLIRQARKTRAASKDVPGRVLQ